MKFKVIEFKQYPVLGEQTNLLLFAAPAKAIHAWAGIPRKGWRIRMLFQRGVSKKRQNELKSFWNSNASEPLQSAVLGPTALTLGLLETPVMVDGQIELKPSVQLDPEMGLPEQLGRLAQKVLPQVIARLTDEQKAQVDEFATSPFNRALPDVAHDYVYEFALQLVQMNADPDQFVAQEDIAREELAELNQSLEALCRPALVIDGQHRLWGAANADREIWLPCVVLPNVDWVEQIYQFIVINEKAERVDSSVLTDIFGSSLTRGEQERLKNRLVRARVDLEARVAAVVAGRDPRSPFLDMVKLKLDGQATPVVRGFITDVTIRLLVDGGARATAGWRKDDDFYNYYVSGAFPDRAQWESWSDGAWQEYWFAFWSEVRNYYNAQQQRELKPDQRSDAVPLWNSESQSNLTKGIALRLLQRLFMEKAVERVTRLDDLKRDLQEELGEEIAEARIQKRAQHVTLPHSLDSFRAQVRDWFLDKGVPVRVFMKPWVKSLDDAAGQEALYKEFCDAFDAAQMGRRYRAEAQGVFANPDKAER